MYGSIPCTRGPNAGSTVSLAADNQRNSLSRQPVGPAGLDMPATDESNRLRMSPGPGPALGASDFSFKTTILLFINFDFTIIRF